MNAVAPMNPVYAPTPKAPTTPTAPDPFVRRAANNWPADCWLPYGARAEVAELSLPGGMFCTWARTCPRTTATASTPR